MLNICCCSAAETRWHYVILLKQWPKSFWEVFGKTLKMYLLCLYLLKFFGFSEKLEKNTEANCFKRVVLSFLLNDSRQQAF